MAVKLPLVLSTGGHPEQLQAADSIDGLLPFPYERYSIQTNNVTNMTSDVLATHLTLAPTILNDGQFEVRCNFNYSSDSTTRDVIVVLRHAGGTQGDLLLPDVIGRIREEMKDRGGPSRVGGTATNQEKIGHFEIDLNLVAGTETFTLEISQGAATDTHTVSIWNSRLSVTRVG